MGLDLLFGDVDSPLFLNIVNMAYLLEHGFHIFLKNLWVYVLMREGRVTKCHQVFRSKTQERGWTRLAQCSLSVQRLLVKQELFPKCHAEEAAVLEALHVAVVGEIAEADLAVENNEDFSNPCILSVEFLSPPQTDDLGEVKDHFERSKSHEPEPGMMQPKLFDQ